MNLVCWSKAGHGTRLVYNVNSKCSLLFDCGSHHELSLKPSHVFITHCHLDHCGGAFIFARLRRGMETTVYVPAQGAEEFERIRDAYEKLDGGDSFHLRVVPVRVGDVLEVSDAVRVTVHYSKHRVPSVGYAVITKTRVMKQRFRDMSSDDKRLFFRDNKDAKRLAYEDIETVDFSYTGDTEIDAIYQDPVYAKSNTFCTEVTFMDADAATVQRAKETGHTHMDEFVRACLEGKLDNCQRIVLMHFSARYSISDIAGCLLAKLPMSILRKIVPMWDAFGVADVLRSSIVATNPDMKIALINQYASLVEWNTYLCEKNDMRISPTFKPRDTIVYTWLENRLREKFPDSNFEIVKT
mmetsp:Transcript_15337/g.24987  ORF Transcript_15337/g.24987 Transcript_15337/m.24987 type:complete len:354 (+) Transcript_15337:3219-4280(+)